jgi:RsiW-degrading membrane proteinase PrsW (M82 family)
MRLAYQNRYPGRLLNYWCIIMTGFLALLMILPLIVTYIIATHPGVIAIPSPSSHSPSFSPAFSPTWTPTPSRERVSVTRAVLGSLATWLFLPPAIVVLFVVFFRHRHRADYFGVSKFMCCGMATVVPVMIAEFLLVLAMGFILGSFMPRKSMIEKLQALQLGEEIKLTSTADYIAALFSVFYVSFVIAGFVEETAKFLLCLFIKSHLPSVQTPMTVVILVTVGALGFGTIENWFYVFAESLKGETLGTVIAAIERALLSVPLHATTGMLIGVSVAKLPTTPNSHPPFREYLKLIWIPILVHGLFDVFALIGGGLGGYFQIIYLVNICILVVAVVRAYRLLDETTKRPPYNTEATFDNSLGV